jgi:hypothetical protein
VPFVALYVGPPHGMMEKWNVGLRLVESLRLRENIGYKKRKKIYSIKNVASTFYDDDRQTFIFYFYFCPSKLRHYYVKINTIIFILIL